MVYFLNEFEMKKLTKEVLPEARKRGVSEELRGWNWEKPPLRPPIPDLTLPVHVVASKYCPTGRDLYLSRIKRIPRQKNKAMHTGVLIHKTVEYAFRSFLAGKIENVPGNPELRKIWELCTQQCIAEKMKISAMQPTMSEHDVIMTAIPYLVELRLNGRLLGFSEDIRVDAFDYLRHIVYDLKVVVIGKQKWHRLYPTAYALVLESVYEIPIDIGVLVYVELLKNKSIRVSKDIFFIDDTLRGELIEERDRKMSLIAARHDPGRPQTPKPCKRIKCPYFETCWGHKLQEELR